MATLCVCRHFRHARRSTGRVHDEALDDYGQALCAIYERLAGRPSRMARQRTRGQCRRQGRRTGLGLDFVRAGLKLIDPETTVDQARRHIDRRRGGSTEPIARRQLKDVRCVTSPVTLGPCPAASATSPIPTKPHRVSRAALRAWRACWDGWRPGVLPRPLSPTQVRRQQNRTSATMNSKSHEFLTVKEVALLLGVSERHVRRLISRPSLPGRRLPSYRIGRFGSHPPQRSRRVSGTADA